jgi:hypothetical protein
VLPRSGLLNVADLSFTPTVAKDGVHSPKQNWTTVVDVDPLHSELHMQVFFCHKEPTPMRSNHFPLVYLYKERIKIEQKEKRYPFDIGKKPNYSSLATIAEVKIRK